MPALRIASYNVHHAVGTDGRRDIQRVAQVVKGLDASVIALQEVGCGVPHAGGAAQIEVLAEATNLRPLSLGTVEKKDAVYGNGLLTALPVLAVRHLDLSFRRYERRWALDVDLAADGGVRLRVVATHLGLHPEERRQQVRRLLETVSHDDDTVTVLLGDINEWFVHGRPLRWLHARFGRGPYTRTWPSFWPLFALDRIWVYPQRCLRQVRSLRTPESRRASDHLPLIATLDWERHDLGVTTSERQLLTGNGIDAQTTAFRQFSTRHGR